MNFGVEHIVLIVTTLAGVAKAYFEMKKAQAASEQAKVADARAGEAEELLKIAVEGVEEAKAEDPEGAARVARKIQKKTVFRGIATQFDEVVQEVTRGSGDIKRVTNKLSRKKLDDAMQQ